MNRPEQLDHMINDTRSLVGDNLNFLPFGAPDLLPVLEYLHELETTIQQVRDAVDHLDVARDQGLVYTYGQIQRTLRKALGDTK